MRLQEISYTVRDVVVWTHRPCTVSSQQTPLLWTGTHRRLFLSGRSSRLGRSALWRRLGRRRCWRRGGSGRGRCQAKTVKSAQGRSKVCGGQKIPTDTPGGSARTCGGGGLLCRLRGRLAVATDVHNALAPLLWLVHGARAAGGVPSGKCVRTLRERQLDRELTLIDACNAPCPASHTSPWFCCLSTHEQHFSRHKGPTCNGVMLADVLAPAAKVENERFFAVSNPAPGTSRGARSFALSMEQQGESGAHGRALKNQTLLNFDRATASKRKGLERDIEKNEEVQQRRAPRVARHPPRLRDAGCCPRLARRNFPRRWDPQKFVGPSVGCCVLAAASRPCKNATPTPTLAPTSTPTPAPRGMTLGATAQDPKKSIHFFSSRAKTRSQATAAPSELNPKQ